VSLPGSGKIQLFWPTGNRISLDRTRLNDWTDATHPHVRPSSNPGKPYFDTIEEPRQPAMTTTSSQTYPSFEGQPSRSMNKKSTWLRNTIISTGFEVDFFS